MSTTDPVRAKAPVAPPAAIAVQEAGVMFAGKVSATAAPLTALGPTLVTTMV